MVQILYCNNSASTIKICCVHSCRMYYYTQLGEVHFLTSTLLLIFIITQRQKLSKTLVGGKLSSLVDVILFSRRQSRDSTAAKSMKAQLNFTQVVNIKCASLIPIIRESRKSWASSVVLGGEENSREMQQVAQ